MYVCIYICIFATVPYGTNGVFLVTEVLVGLLFAIWYVSMVSGRLYVTLSEHRLDFRVTFVFRTAPVY